MESVRDGKMPGGKAKNTSLKANRIPSVLFWPKIIITKVGQLSLYVILGCLFVLKNITLAFSVISLPHIQLPHPHFHLPNFKLYKKRGRPYKKPLALVLWNKIPLKGRIISLVLFFAAIFLVYTFVTFKLAAELPSPSRLLSPNQSTTTFYDRNGKVLYRFYEGKNRTLIKLSDLPKYIPEATITIEDKHFYSHPGVDFAAILRAVVHNLQNKDVHGASTITQQLVKNSLLNPEKTYTRKVKEIILALWTERIFSKNEILQMYLNEAPYGGPTWGIEAAAQTYFGKGAVNLDLAETAYLAGLPASPTDFSPYGSHPKLAKIRQSEVLRRMVEDKYITKEQALNAEKEDLHIKPPTIDIQAPHFVMYVRDLLAQKYGLRTVSQGGLKVTTTLDLGLQHEVEKIVSDEVDKLKDLSVSNGAVMVTDAKTGQILAMVGSRDYFYSGFGNFNATTALRQPGSSIKPVTYVTAFKKGYSPGNTVLDTPVIFSDEWGNYYSPGNYDDTFHGPISLRTALGSSYNVPAVKMLATVGVDDMIQTAKDLGITTFTEPKKYGLSLTLGAAEVKMVDMMSVYGTFAQLGIQRKPAPILKVEDSNGNTLEEYQNSGHQVLQPEVAYLITSILSDNQARTPAFGPNSLLNIPPNAVAVKTGTSDNKKDNWTFGYSEDFVVGVWVGNNNGDLMNQSLTSGITGAAPIWNRIMKGILAKNPSLAFTKPTGVIEVSVDGRKDLAVSGILPKGLVRAKLDTDKTTYFDSFSSYSTSSATAAIKTNAIKTNSAN